MTQTTIYNNINYKEISKEWLKNKNKHGKVLNSYYYITNNFIYIVDGSKKVQLNYSLKELEVAKWLANTFGGTVYMKPKINYPYGIKTADYYWNGEYWDLKELKNITSKSRAIDNIIKNKKYQSHNFILDITNCKIPIDIILNQTKKLFNIKNEKRQWVNKIIIKNNNKVLKIYIRK